jgi:hypothetical protein
MIESSKTSVDKATNSMIHHFIFVFEGAFQGAVNKFTGTVGPEIVQYTELREYFG